MAIQADEKPTVSKEVKYFGRVYSYNCNTRCGFMQLSFTNRKVAFKDEDLSKVSGCESMFCVNRHFKFDIVKDSEGVEYAVNFEV